MVMIAREAVVNYMTPLRLHHQMATDNHSGVEPSVVNLKRPEWNPVHYSRADANGIDFDRTATGTERDCPIAAKVQA